jgi:hypothetical protein
MALWGKADNLFSPGTVAVDYAAKTITGTGTSFRAAGISTGTVIAIGVGGTFGQAVISKVTSETEVSIATTQYLSGASISGVGYTLSQKPISTLEDSNYDLTPTTSPKLTNAIYGVDVYEAAAVAVASTTHKVAHAGWVGIHTYTDMHGNLRVKSEVLVAMSGISTNGLATYTATGDAADDAVFPDRYITISSQPSNLGLTTTTSGTFGATASATPAAALSYQWKVSTNGGTSYSNATGGIYSNGTTATLTVTNPPLSANNNLYRVVISSTGGAPNVTSNSATLTVTA